MKEEKAQKYFKINKILSETGVVIALETQAAHKRRTGKKLKIAKKKNAAAQRTFLSYVNEENSFKRSFAKRLHVHVVDVEKTEEFLVVRPLIIDYFQEYFPFITDVPSLKALNRSKAKAWRDFLANKDTYRVAYIRNQVASELQNHYKRVNKALLDKFMNMMILDHGKLIAFYQRQTSEKLKAMIRGILFSFHQDQIYTYYHYYSPYGEYSIDRNKKNTKLNNSPNKKSDRYIEIPARTPSEESEYIAKCWEIACDTVIPTVASVVTLFETIYERDCYDRMKKATAQKKVEEKEIAKMRADRVKGLKIRDVLEKDEKLIEELNKKKVYTLSRKYKDEYLELQDLEDQASLKRQQDMVQEIRSRIIFVSLRIALQRRIQESSSKKEKGKYEKCLKLINLYSDVAVDKEFLRTWRIAEHDDSKEYTNKQFAKLLGVDESHIPNLYSELKNVIEEDLDFDIINKEVNMRLYCRRGIIGIEEYEKFQAELAAYEKARAEWNEKLQKFDESLSLVLQKSLPNEKIVL